MIEEDAEMEECKWTDLKKGWGDDRRRVSNSSISPPLPPAAY